jgi:transposase
MQRRSVVAESTTIIAFDQHAQSVVAAVLEAGASEPAVHALAADLPSIGRFVTRIAKHAAVRCGYEAGSCGFSLQRFLTTAGMPCEILAPSLIPRRSGDRIKTDRRDARQLAVLYRAGASPRSTSRRNTKKRSVICCGVARTFEPDLLRARHRLSKFLLRHNRRYAQTKTAWTRRHTVWLQTLEWPLPALEQTFRSYVHAVNEAEGRLQLVEDDLRGYFTTGPFAQSVCRLRCFRGIRELTALTIAAELGDARRFPSAPRVMGFAGLVPSEHSSGSRRGRGAITKTGNAHLRRVLLEAAWHYRHHPHLGLSLRSRQEGAPPDVVARAWQAQHRLFRTYRRLIGRGRPPQVATTAVARELAGFVWATLAS